MSPGMRGNCVSSMRMPTVKPYWFCPPRTRPEVIGPTLPYQRRGERRRSPRHPPPVTRGGLAREPMAPAKASARNEPSSTLRGRRRLPPAASLPAPQTVCSRREADPDGGDERFTRRPRPRKTPRRPQDLGSWRRPERGPERLARLDRARRGDRPAQTDHRGGEPRRGDGRDHLHGPPAARRAGPPLRASQGLAPRVPLALESAGLERGPLRPRYR